MSDKLKLENDFLRQQIEKLKKAIVFECCSVCEGRLADKSYDDNCIDGCHLYQAFIETEKDSLVIRGQA